DELRAASDGAGSHEFAEGLVVEAEIEGRVRAHEDGRRIGDLVGGAELQRRGARAVADDDVVGRKSGAGGLGEEKGAAVEGGRAGPGVVAGAGEGDEAGPGDRDVAGAGDRLGDGGAGPGGVRGRRAGEEGAAERQAGVVDDRAVEGGGVEEPERAGA